MKKILHTILFLLPFMAIAQTNFYVYKTDGTVETYAVSDVEKISFTAPEEPEEPVVTTKVLTFEDSDAKFPAYSLDYCGVNVEKWSDLIPAADEQAYPMSALIYGTNNDATYNWSDVNNTGLYHTFPYNWGGYSFSGGGMVVSNITTTLEAMEQDYNIYNHQLAILNETGANGSSNFAIVYNDSQVNTEVKNTLSFADGNAHTIKSMYVCIPAISLYCMLNGNEFSEAYDEDDFLKLVATGKKADGSESSVEFVLAEGNNYDTWAFDWTKWDLSALGEVVSVSFHMEEAQIDDYGYAQYYKTPLYFAFDDVEVQ
jgi:hypothetical protein